MSTDFPAIVIAACESDIYQEVDGFYVFSTDTGFLDATSLRIIADELDRRNADWKATIDNDPAIGKGATS